MCWHFGPFRLDPGQAELWCAEQLVPLRPKALALLAALVHQAGQLVTKEALLEYHLKNSRLKVHALTGCHNEGKWA
jgi:DNA-binding winged helix-turn-helix (wHTH) protein